MIESFIGRPGSRLRRLLRAMSLVGATSFSLFAGTMLLASPAALAAGPEAPKTEPASGLTATTATLTGLVNPEAVSPVEAGTWEFLYKATKTITKAECESGGASKAPIPPGAYAGAGPEGFATAVTGLTAATEYVVCMRVEGETTKEATVGAPVAFKTAVPPQQPVTSSPAKAITATTATFEGELNPTKEAETGYYFAYSIESEGPCTTSGATTASVAAATVMAKTKVQLEAAGLQPHQKYIFCLIATNTAEPPEAVPSTNEVKFETAAAPPEVTNEQIPGLVNSPEIATASDVNPNNQTTECHVQYGEKLLTEAIEHEVACTPPSLSGFGEQGVGVTLTGLNPGGKYHYQIVAKNEKSEEVHGPEDEFETVTLPSKVEAEAEEVTTESAKLGGKLDPGGEATYYIEWGTAPCGASSCGTRLAEEGISGKTQKRANFMEVSGLAHHTTYHYWLVATNGAGIVRSQPKEFTTDVAPREIEINEAKNITTTSAELTGALNPGSEGTYYFEYEPAECPGAIPHCPSQTAAVVLTAETQESVVPVTLSGLQPNTAYRYWLVVTNASLSEPVDGQTGAFRTAATAAEVAKEESNKTAEEEAATTKAAQQKLEEETRKREEAVAALTAAQNKKYNEINAVLAASKLQEEALAKTEATIADTSVKIVKAKVTVGSVVLTIQVSQAGNVTVTGADIQKQTAKLSIGTHTITVKLTKAGRAARKGHKKASITVTLDTSLTSVSAATSVKL